MEEDQDQSAPLIETTWIDPSAAAVSLSLTGQRATVINWLPLICFSLAGILLQHHYIIKNTRLYLKISSIIKFYKAIS